MIGQIFIFCVRPPPSVFSNWNNTDIGYTLHKDIGYTCEEYCAVSVEVKAGAKRRTQQGEIYILHFSYRPCRSWFFVRLDDYRLRPPAVFVIKLQIPKVQVRIMKFGDTFQILKKPDITACIDLAEVEV